MARLEPELGHALLARVRVVVTEMVSACVWNGGGGTVAVEVTVRPDTVRGEVTELGPKTDPTSPDPSPFPRGGFGLLLVRRLADRTGAMAGRRGMWFEIDRSDDG
jgi:anti-sigma regulatory factor (Ser/Thr protein kinase)